MGVSVAPSNPEVSRTGPFQNTKMDEDLAARAKEKEQSNTLHAYLCPPAVTSQSFADVMNRSRQLLCEFYEVERTNERQFAGMLVSA